MIRFFLSCLFAVIITVAIFHLMSNLVSIEDSAAEINVFPAGTIDTMPKTLLEVQTIDVRTCDDETIAKAKDELQQYRSCKVAADCIRIDYIFLDSIAINKANQRYTDPIINGLKLICGTLTAYTPAFDGGGIEIRCTEQTSQCDVFKLPAKPKHRPKTLDFST